jgi:UDP:flavonoid glycosyltransferase YjiC (YdhE family)
MAKILCLPECEFLAHSTRPLEICKALRSDGCEILVASSGRYLKLFENEGFKCISTPSLEEAVALPVLRKGRLNVWNKKKFQKALQSDLQIAAGFKPELILSDFRLTAKTVCEKLKIPFISILNASWTQHYRVPLRAPENFIITRLFGKRLTTFLIPLLKNWMINWDCLSLNAVRKEVGCPKKLNFLQMLEGDLNLLVDIPKYAPIEQLKSNYVYVGNVSWSPELGLPEWYSKLDPNKKIVYFTVGSTGALEHVKDLLPFFNSDEYQLCVTTGGVGKIDLIQSNLFVAEMVPGEKILEKAHLIVCHGGNGTIYQALSMGVPVVGIPTMHDQEFNMQRVEDLGLGKSISHLHFDLQEAVGVIKEVLNDGIYKKRAIEFSNDLKKYHSKEAASKTIFQFFNLIASPMKS